MHFISPFPLDTFTASCTLLIIAISIYVLQPTTVHIRNNPTQQPLTRALPAGLYNYANTCFINSVVQALTSLSHFKAYLCLRTNKNTTVTNALLELFTILNPLRQPHLVTTPSALTNAIHSNDKHEHLRGYLQQDAQEFFQVLSSAITKEEQEKYISPLFHWEVEKDCVNYIYHSRKTCMPRFTGQRNPFTGLVASRIMCLKCGYKSPLRHETFDNLSLALNNSQTTQPVSIPDLIKSYTTPEIIYDYTCDKCSFQATKSHFQANLKSFPKSSQKKYQTFLKTVHDLHSFDTCEYPSGLKRIRIGTTATKQIYISSPPKCLCFHIQRSVYHYNHVSKNHCPVLVPETLNLDPFINTKISSGWETNTRKNNPEYTTSDNQMLKKIKTFGDYNTKSSQIFKEKYALKNNSNNQEVGHGKYYDEGARLSTDLIGKIGLDKFGDSKLESGMQQSLLMEFETETSNVHELESQKSSRMGFERDVTNNVSVPESLQIEFERVTIDVSAPESPNSPQLELTNDTTNISAPKSPQLEFAQEQDSPAPQPTSAYTLKSVILHYGSHETGHFMTFKKLDNDWYQISDGNVVKLFGDFNTSSFGSNIYMVFYERLST